MSPDEVRVKTKGLMQPSPSVIVFVVKEANPDNNISIQYTSDARRDAPTNVVARQFFQNFAKQYPNILTQKIPGARFVSQRIIDMAGGVAFESTFISLRGETQMIQKTILLIVKGKAFTITCTSPEATYFDVDREGFDPVLKSLSFK